jgi:type IV pilus assembly protein PilC
VVAVLLYKVIPTFEEMFSNFGDAALPAPTQFVIDVSNSFVDDFLYYLTAAIVLPVIFGYLMRQRKFRRKFDTYVLKLPIFGPVLRKAAVARFTRTLGTMVSSGVPILDALDIVGKSSGNIRIEEAIGFVRGKIAEGSTMSDPLMETGIFPEMVVQMISVGEATGAMDTMLNKIADFYEEEVDVAVDNLTALIEPLMMVVIGGIVGSLLIAMYLPIFTIAGSIKT